MASDFEQARLERIAANRRKVEELGLARLGGIVPQEEKKQRKPREKKPEPTESQERRCSQRERPKVSYKEEDYYGDLGKATRPVKPPRTLDEGEVEELRQRNGVAVEEEPGSAKKRGPQDSGKGVRIQGGKVYDSTYGVTCHWCRQKTLEDHVVCSHPGCGKGKRLPTCFCKNCLRNRHGEDCDLAYLSNAWVCPCCRGNCGKGCVTCCNCGPCRKKAGLEPTHQVLKSAREVGFDNVHDYLVHLVTGEAPEVISARKSAFPWGKWLQGEVGAPADDVHAEAAAGAAAKAAAPRAAGRRKGSAAGTEGAGLPPKPPAGRAAKRQKKEQEAAAADAGAPASSSDEQLSKAMQRQPSGQPPSTPPRTDQKSLGGRVQHVEPEDDSDDACGGMQCAQKLMEAEEAATTKHMSRKQRMLAKLGLAVADGDAEVPAGMGTAVVQVEAA